MKYADLCSCENKFGIFLKIFVYITGWNSLDFFITDCIGQLRINPNNRGYLSKRFLYIERLEYVM